MPFPLTTPAAARMVRGQRRPLVSLLSDWSNRDPSAAICRGVIAAIAPDALLVDISHEVEPYNIRHGALLLWSALPFLPVGAHMAVVDPGVGSARRAIAIETLRGDFLVGPDNGLLLPGAERLGGIVGCHLLESPQYRLPVVTNTFHGRDLFAPAAAHLAMGVPLAEFGPPVDPLTLVAFEWPASVAHAGRLETSVVYVDSFGNAKLAALTGDLVAALGEVMPSDLLEVSIGPPGRRRAALPWAQSFSEIGVGRALLFEDSYGRLAIGVNQGSAAKQLGLRVGSRLEISRAQAAS